MHTTDDTTTLSLSLSSVQLQVLRALLAEADDARSCLGLAEQLADLRPADENGELLATTPEQDAAFDAAFEDLLLFFDVEATRPR